MGIWPRSGCLKIAWDVRRNPTRAIGVVEVVGLCRGDCGARRSRGQSEGFVAVVVVVCSRLLLLKLNPRFTTGTMTTSGDGITFAGASLLAC